MKQEPRTQSQHSAYWLFQSWISAEMRAQWIPLEKLVVEIQPQPTKENLHVIFKGILEKMYHKTSTKQMTRDELNDCLSVYMDALSCIGLQIDFPDASRKSLLDSIY